MNNERNEMSQSNGETTATTNDVKTEEKRDKVDDHDHLWIDIGGEG